MSDSYSSSSDSDVFAALFASIFGLGFTSLSLLWTCMYCLIFIASIAGMVLWVIMLIDAARREDKDFPDKGDNQKMIWILVLVLGGWIGAVVYYFLVYKKAQKS